MVRYSAEVREAMEGSKPIVALESTIIAHGMPYPQNMETAIKVEDIVRERGATPATVAIIGGVIHIGLEQAELEKVAQLGSTEFMKTSRRDLAVVVGGKKMGATTVSGTAYLASTLGNIDVFVTGGIGGVHRGGEMSLDESADLAELAQTPMTVVCAGVKSILDIPRTLERLETLGIPVLGFETDEFPAFFSRHSGCKVPHRVETAEECARVIRASRALGLRSGSIVAVPIPTDHAADGDIIEQAIQQTLLDAEAEQVEGKALTPFILERLNTVTGGMSLKANIALVKNNAAVGADIAVALADLTSTGTGTSTAGATDTASATAGSGK